MPFDSEIPTRSRDLIILEKARERIARGWCQRADQHDDNVCLVRAVSDVLGYHRYDPYGGIFAPDVQRAIGALGLFSGDTGEPSKWNDAPGRTQAEVLARFDAAIERLSS